MTDRPVLDHSKLGSLTGTGYALAEELDEQPAPAAPPGVLVLDFRPIVRAINRGLQEMGRVVRDASAAFLQLMRAVEQPPPSPLTLGHAFKPDFDLYCTNGGCGRTAEEH